MADIKDFLKDVQENIPLARYTTFKIGGPARYFFAAKNSADVKKAAEAAKKTNVPYYVTGNGSNLLVSDNGFNGLVIRMENREIKIAGDKMTVGAGVIMGKAVDESVKAGLKGLEWMKGVPGTLGGAIYGNAGAFGHNIGESAERIEALDAENLSIKYLSKDECNFSYRNSVFKSKKYVILSAELKLEKGNKEESEKLVKEYIKKRLGRHPIGPSAGSVFKNPRIAENEKAFEKILAKYPEAEKFKSTGTIPAGWLIEEYGLLGKKIGGAEVSEKHGNFIINTGNAAATDVITLISLIKQKIRVNFGIQLEEEIQYVGF